MDPIKIVEATAILILGGWQGFTEWRVQRKAKLESAFRAQYGLPENPTRCQDHAKAINALCDDVQEIKNKLGIV